MMIILLRNHLLLGITFKGYSKSIQILGKTKSWKLEIGKIAYFSTFQSTPGIVGIAI